MNHFPSWMMAYGVLNFRQIDPLFWIGASKPTCRTAKNGLKGALSRLGYMITKWKERVLKSTFTRDAEAVL